MEKDIQVFTVSGIGVSAALCSGLFYANRYPWIFRMIMRRQARILGGLLFFLSYVSLVVAASFSFLRDDSSLWMLQGANLLLFVLWCHLFLAHRAFRGALYTLSGNVLLILLIAALTQVHLVMICMLLHVLWLFFLMLLTALVMFVESDHLVQRKPTNSV
jgi:hypothetical protein